MIINGHKGFAAAVAWSPDSSRLASVGMDGFVRIWDSDSGDMVSEQDAHEGAATAVIFTSLGREVVSGARDGELKVWSLPDLDLRFELTGHSDRIGAIAAHADGSPIISVSDDGNILVSTDADQSLQIEGLGGRMTTVDLSADGTMIAAAGQGGEIMVYDMLSGRPTRLEGHEDAVGAVRFSTSGMQLYSLGFEGVMRVWDASSWNVEDVVPVGGFGPFAVAAGGTIMAIAVDEKIVTMNRNGSVSAERSIGDLQVSSMAYSPSGDKLAAACTDGTLRVWPTDY